MSTMHLTGDLVRFLRINVNKQSQRAFGKAIGFSYVYVCQIETGVVPMTARFERAVINTLGLTEDDVMKYQRIINEIN